jgi:hypothetical protein
MITSIEMSLRTWYPDGRPVNVDDFATILDPGTKYRVVGGGGAWETARIVVYKDRLESFKDSNEPHEAFSQSFRYSQTALSHWLSGLMPTVLDGYRSKGMKLDLFLDVWIDQNQVELEISNELIAEMGRLSLPMKIVSND